MTLTPLLPLMYEPLVRTALLEDLGRAGDVTSVATIPETTAARAVLVTRKAGVIAGLPLAAAAFLKLAPDADIKAQARDGASVAAKAALLHVNGPARGASGGAGGDQSARPGSCASPDNSGYLSSYSW